MGDATKQCDFCGTPITSDDQMCCYERELVNVRDERDAANAEVARLRDRMETARKMASAIVRRENELDEKNWPLPEDAWETLRSMATTARAWLANNPEGEHGS